MCAKCGNYQRQGSGNYQTLVPPRCDEEGTQGKKGGAWCNIQGSTTEAAEGLPMHATLHKIGPLRRARGE